MLFSYIYLLLIYLLINIYWYNYMACNILMKLMFKNNYEKNIHTYIFIRAVNRLKNLIAINRMIAMS